MASFHCLLACLLFSVVGAGHAKVKDAEHLICSERGLSFMMDNGMSWSSKPEGIIGQEERDYTCLFQVCMLDSGKVRITDYKNEYLTLANDGSNKIKTVKTINKPNTEFELLYKNEKVQFKASNQRFCSRVYYLVSGKHTLEASKAQADPFTQFQLVTC